MEVKNGMCFQVEVLVSLTNTFSWSGVCAFSEVVPNLRIYGKRSRQLDCGQMGSSWTNLPDIWWSTFEVLLYKDILVTALQGPLSYAGFPHHNNNMAVLSRKMNVPNAVLKKVR